MTLIPYNPDCPQCLATVEELQRAWAATRWVQGLLEQEEQRSETLRTSIKLLDSRLHRALADIEDLKASIIERERQIALLEDQILEGGERLPE